MKSLYLIMYRMRGNRRIYTVPVYAATLPEATGKFRDVMAGNGCERSKYAFVTHREIAEGDIRWYLQNNTRMLQRLSPDDRATLLQDWKAQQPTELARIDGNANQMLEQFQPA